ncbi:unnamed protein product [Ilex paraguariensis]|uniref:RNase H type-1 domain-containing protein n=1 Tax=Ilex paraguariensis TaxID=185542 RepID=A0ABC8RVG2_9AQUA
MYYMTRELCFKHIEPEVNSKTMVAILPEEGENDHHSLVLQIRALLRLEWHVQIQHVYRKANACVD